MFLCVRFATPSKSSVPNLAIANQSGNGKKADIIECQLEEFDT